MPELVTRNMSRSITSFATKLVVDFTCEPNVRKQREAELTAALKEFTMMYQKHTNSVNGAFWHVQIVKVLKDNMSAVNANIIANANNAINSANVDSTALVRVNNAVNAVNANSTALIPVNNAANAVSANITALVPANNITMAPVPVPTPFNRTALVPANNITMAPVPVPAPFNSTALVPANTTNMNPVAINNMNDNINNTNKRPGDNGQDNASKRSKTEEAPGTTTTFNINTNGPSTTRFHTGVYMAEFMLVGSGSIQVHTPGVPAFVQPAPAALAARAPARAIAGAGGSNQGKSEVDDSPSKRPVPLDMYL